jgi:hypothetical protein
MSHTHCWVPQPVVPQVPSERFLHQLVVRGLITHSAEPPCANGQHGVSTVLASIFEVANPIQAIFCC